MGVTLDLKGSVAVPLGLALAVTVKRRWDQGCAARFATNAPYEGYVWDQCGSVPVL